jgi:hypothetical protein
MKPRTNTCAVCGYHGLRFPQRRSNGRPSRELCPSCGFHSGQTDDVDGHDPVQWRTQWVGEGMKWVSETTAKPDDWHPFRSMTAMLNRKRPSLPGHILRKLQAQHERETAAAIAAAAIAS